MFDIDMKDSIWSDNPAKFLKECKRLRALCQRIADGKETLIEGCLKMMPYRFWMREEDNPDWEIFGVVSSDTDHLPIGEVRQYWAPDVLKRKEREIAEIEAFYRADVLRAVEQIGRTYGEYVE